MKKRAAELEAYVNMSEARRREYVAVHDRADHVARCFGDSAPRWNVGESLDDYRRRLVNKFKRFSPTWAAVDLTTVAGAPHLVAGLLDRAETQVFADALEASRRPSSYAPGELREIKTADPSGRVMSRFVGDFEAAFGMFKLPARHMQIAKPDFWS